MRTNIIPKGPYCYAIKEVTERGVSRTSACPFWLLVANKPQQMNGYCRYLNVGDWDKDSLGNLWNKCKECNINLDEENSYLEALERFYGVKNKEVSGLLFLEIPLR